MTRATEMKKYYKEVKQLPLIDSFDNGYKNELRGDHSFLVIIVYNQLNRIVETWSENIMLREDLLRMWQDWKTE